MFCPTLVAVVGLVQQRQQHELLDGLGEALNDLLQFSCRLAQSKEAKRRDSRVLSHKASRMGQLRESERVVSSGPQPICRVNFLKSSPFEQRASSTLVLCSCPRINLNLSLRIGARIYYATLVHSCEGPLGQPDGFLPSAYRCCCSCTSNELSLVEEQEEILEFSSPLRDEPGASEIKS